MKNLKRKQLFAGISAAAMTAVLSAAMNVSAADVIYGDANCDGTVTIADATAILQSIGNADKYALSAQGAKNADVYNRGDGITGMDAISVQKYDAKVIASLPESYKDGYTEPGSTDPTEAPVKPTEAPTEAPTEPIEVEKVETYIHLNGNSATIEGKYAEANGANVTISHSGSYYIDGKLNNGQIYVNVPDEKADPGTVKLIFKGVDIKNTSNSPIFVKNADKTSITLADGTENFLSDGETPYSGDNEGNAVIEAKDDLTIKGDELDTGRLVITAGTQTAVSCNNDLKITGGIIDIETLDKENENDGLKGKKSLTIKGGDINIKSEGDALKSSKGNVVIEGGTITAKAGNDAVQAETTIEITGGELYAFGSRGLRSVEPVTISGGTVLATAVDYQCETFTDASQGAYMFDFVKEWEKNNPITLLDGSGNTVFDVNTRKKFSYAVVSSPELSAGTSYDLYTGGIQMLDENGSAMFKAGTPAHYINVNNCDDAQVLYADMFDQSRIHKVEIRIEQSAWDDLIKNADKEEYHMCDVVIDGETIKNVGVRTKGNSSRMFVSNAGGTKFSLRVKLNEYDKQANYHGLTEFCMNNMYSDPSCMRDTLCYNAMYNLGAYAPKTAYTDMYLNGELYSFYFLAEQPGKTLAERLGTDNDSCLYKATDQGTDLCNFGPNMPLTNFDLKYGNDESRQHIGDVVKAINSITPQNYKFIEDCLDVESFLKGFAVNAVMCNYDSYNGSMAHNYYAMYSNGKLKYVGWDYNLALGNFMDYGASAESDIKTGLYQIEADKRPLLKNLLAVPEYYDMYVGYVKEIMGMYSDPEGTVNRIASLIRDHVKADPRGFFDGDKFETNISKSAEGLQINNGGGGGMWGGGGFGGGWGGGFGGWGGGGFGGMWGGGGGNGAGFSFGGENVSIVDFMVKRWEVIRNALG